MKDRTALPIVMADTSALRDLMAMEIAGDQLSPKKGGMVFSTAETIDALCVKGNRTLMMPGSVLTELFPTLTGRLSLVRNENGQAAFPIGVPQEILAHAHENSLYHYFSKLAQEGKLRCYRNPEEMLAAGEIDHPKGGVVFVSMGETIAPNGQVYSESKARKLMRPIPVANKVEASTSRSSSDQPASQPLKSKALNDKRQSIINPYADQGDRDIFDLVATIDEYAQSIGIKPRLLLFNSDGGLDKRFANSVGDAVTFARPLPLIHSMVQIGLLHERTARAADNAVIDLSATDSTSANRVLEMYSEQGQQVIGIRTQKTTSWLEATRTTADTPGKGK